jgi:hypothetical protein
MRAMERDGWGSVETDGAAPQVVERLVALRRRTVAEAVGPLEVEAEGVEREIEVLRDAARRKVWEAIVQTREIHDRICDASARLEHLQLDIREQTGKVRLPAVPVPFVEFLMSEIRRFVVTAATPERDKLRALGG